MRSLLNGLFNATGHLAGVFMIGTLLAVLSSIFGRIFPVLEVPGADAYAGYCMAASAFLALAAWLITSYRVRKIRRSGDEVILGRGGAFLNGSFHAWNMPGAGITDLAYEPPGGKQEPGELRIEYAAGIHPAPVTETLILQIPAELEDKIPRVLQALDEGRGH